MYTPHPTSKTFAIHKIRCDKDLSKINSTLLEYLVERSFNMFMLNNLNNA